MLESKDESEGACNRAYYAMFYAAHAALRIVAIDVLEYKTHRGLVAAFGKQIVMPGLIDTELGRSLNEVQKLREVADYLGDPPPKTSAAAAVVLAASFVAAVERLLRKRLPGPTTS